MAQRAFDARTPVCHAGSLGASVQVPSRAIAAWNVEMSVDSLLQRDEVLLLDEEEEHQLVEAEHVLLLPLLSQPEPEVELEQG
jgi:hypothetical protein